MGVEDLGRREEEFVTGGGLYGACVEGPHTCMFIALSFEAQ